MIDDYSRFQERLREMAKLWKPRSRAEGLRRTMRLLRGRKFRAVRKLLKRQLGWHRRWEAEAFIALNPWQEDAACCAWRDMALESGKRPLVR